MKNRSSFAKLRNVLFFVFLALFIISATLLAVSIFQRENGNRIYEDAKDIFASAVDNGFEITLSESVSGLEADKGSAANESITDKLGGAEQDTQPADDEKKEYNEVLEKVRAGLNSLRQINEDIYGWIKVSGTSIDYPIMQCGNNDHYLNHAYNGEYSPLGSIFADYRCSDKITDNLNTVLYGHNLLTGGSDMFHDIEMFLDREFFTSARIIVYTFDGIYVYEPFSVYEARYDYNYYKTEFHDEEAFIAFANAVTDNSRHENDVSFSAEDRILTLSTCTNYEHFTRYALHAKLINAIED